MKLHLLRHAKTEITSHSGHDFDRKLMLKGIIQSNMLGQYMLDHSLSFKETYCSDAVRTRETLEILRSFVDCGNIQFKKDFYLADRDTYLKQIWKLEHGNDILIVGHNDGISSLATYLTDNRIHLKTCGYVCIEFSDESWKETSVGTGAIFSQFRPQAYLLS